MIFLFLADSILLSMKYFSKSPGYYQSNMIMIKLTMRFISLFSKHMLLVYRCISIIAEILISVFTIYTLAYGIFTFSDFHFYINLVAFALVLCAVIFPMKIEFLAASSFIYSMEILLTTSLNKNLLGFMLYILTCAILFSRGFFRKNRIAKTIASVIFFFAIFATQLRFGTSEFLKSLFILAEYSFVIFLIILFYYLYLRNQGKSPIEKILDLSQFPDLTERDKEWIELILQETKYITIASQYNVTEGTVKNRMRVIFRILDVSDRIGFMATFGGYEIKK